MVAVRMALKVADMEPKTASFDPGGERFYGAWILAKNTNLRAASTQKIHSLLHAESSSTVARPRVIRILNGKSFTGRALFVVHDRAVQPCQRVFEKFYLVSCE